MDEALFDVRPAVRPTGRRLRFDADDPLLAAAAWSRIAEPGDEVAGALVANLGAPGALLWLAGVAGDPESAVDHLGPGRAAPVVESPEPSDPQGRARRRSAADRLVDAVGRWAPRLESLDPRRELRVLERHDGALLVPGDPRWPAGLGDLGAAAPFALWVRGTHDVASASLRSVAVVGARASTSYGDRVAADLSAGLADRGFTVVSGGAYGIDAAAHRGALAGAGTTIAVLAGGVDRFYPQGNDDLLRRVLAAGAVLSEVPPGSAPFKQRFLARNRLIAALTRATVVVEAAHRSGALSTARRAVELLRPLGVVPGPVTSMASAGCHALLRDHAAVCVTRADEVAELAGGIGTDVLAPQEAGAGRETDTSDPDEKRLLDALPVRSAATIDSLAAAAGLPPRQVLRLLGSFEQRGLAGRDGARWRRTS